MSKQPRALRSSDIDVLRGFAIFAILLLHAGLMTDGIEAYPYLSIVVQRMSTGMQLFFVISGYLVSISFDSCIASGKGVRGFLIRRAAKILPLYLIFLHLNIFIFLVNSAFAPDVAAYRNSVTSESLTWLNYFLHIGFLQGFFPKSLHTFLDGSWSIVIEVYFYLLFPIFFARICRSSIGSAWMYVLSLGLAILFILLLGRYFSRFSHYGFPAQLPCFLLGVLVHRISQEINFKNYLKKWREVIITVCMLLMLGLVKGESKPLGDSNIYALCFSAILLVSSGLSNSLGPKLSVTFVKFGRQTYALYFVHLALLKCTYIYFEYQHINLLFWPKLAINLFIAIPVTWVIATLIFDRIDRYFVALADRSLNRSQLDNNHNRTQA